MKLLFKRKEKNPASKPNMVSRRIHTGYKYLQGGWAGWMKKRTRNFSHRTWIIVLVFFILSGSTCSIYIATKAFLMNKGNSIMITPIKKPRRVMETGEEKITGPEISQAEYNRIKQFRIYMDSLVRSPSGKIHYDSITSLRPGLMDSVRLIENYYQQLNHK